MNSCRPVLLALLSALPAGCGRAPKAQPEEPAKVAARAAASLRGEEACAFVLALKRGEERNRVTALGLLQNPGDVFLHKEKVARALAIVREMRAHVNNGRSLRRENQEQ